MRICAFTMVYNERIFLPIWYEYYGKALGYENLFLLDHGSDDGSSSFFNSDRRVVLPRTELDEFLRGKVVSEFQRDLLKKFDVVIFTDCDEMLVPRSEFGGLRNFIEKFSADVIRAVGLDLIQIEDLEQPIDLSRPILEQRSYVKVNLRYSKTLISRVPLNWKPGFHRCNIPTEADGSLFLVHLKKMDSNISLESQYKLNTIQWSEESIAAGHGRQFRIPPDVFVKKNFGIKYRHIKEHNILPFDQTDFSLINIHGQILSVPESYKTVIPPIDEGARVINTDNIVSFDYAGKNIKFCVNNRKDHIQSVHCSGQFYELEELNLIRAHIENNSVFVDIGANVGNHSVFLGLMLSLKRIIVFEPNPPAMRLLKCNAQINRLENIIDLSRLGIGLSDRMDMVSIQFSERNLGGAKMTVDTDSQDLKIPIVTGDILLAGEDIDFIKIDVEGMEIKVLQGLTKTISRNRPKIFIEVDNVNIVDFHTWCKDNSYAVVERFRRYKSNENFLIKPIRLSDSR